MRINNHFQYHRNRARDQIYVNLIDKKEFEEKCAKKSFSVNFFYFSTYSIQNNSMKSHASNRKIEGRERK